MPSAVATINGARSVEELKRELAEAREQQAATAEILRVISNSPTDMHRVFAVMAASAVRLCDAQDAMILLIDGNILRLVAHEGPMPVSAPVGLATMPLARGTVMGRAVLDRRTIQVADLQAEGEEYPEGSDFARRLGHRTILAVPLIGAGQVIGTISVRRTEVRPFTDPQVQFLETFADQAVIAIENARLFEEVQMRNRDLTETMARQIATSEVLRAISRVQTDAQPVFDMIAASALRLCGAGYGQVALYDGALLHMTAFDNVSPEGVEALRRRFPAPADHGSAMGRAIHSGAVVQIPDVLADPAYAFKSEIQTMGFRSLLVVPMLAKDGPIGAIAVGRAGCGPFPESQIELLKTFADQAVIAVENTRLFQELQARNRDLTALREVGRAVSSTLDLRVVLKTIVDRAVARAGTDAGAIFYYRPEVARFELGETAGIDQEFIIRLRNFDIVAKDSGLGEAIAQRKPLLISDLTKRQSNPLRAAVIEAGFRAALIVPLLSSDGPLGALVLQRRQPGEFPQTVVTLMESFADQSAIALENARLFEEIARKSRELEIASQHKSQFVANMSHELRTPLAAMLGYAELLKDGTFGELPEKSIRILERVQANGKHLLGLINTVLDIAKIESGQFKLNLGEYSLDSMIETVRVATESLASAKKLSLRTDVAEDLPYGHADEPRLTQVLLNLVGNAIKFTDAGEVCIAAGTKSGSFVISVSDTGPGIPYEERERIFDKFHQVDGTSTKTKGGTGLGLAIAKDIIEMHGGRIWVESIVGRGSTFRLELPVRTQTSRAAA